MKSTQGLALELVPTSVIVIVGMAEVRVDVSVVKIVDCDNNGVVIGELDKDVSVDDKLEVCGMVVVDVVTNVDDIDVCGIVVEVDWIVVIATVDETLVNCVEGDVLGMMLDVDCDDGNEVVDKMVVWDSVVEATVENEVVIPDCKCKI